MRVRSALVLLTAGALFAAGSAGAEGEIAIHSRAGSFDDVKNSLVFAIENRGLVVSTVSHVGEMLERTGRDLGVAERLFVQGDVLEFCSAVLSRQVMEADPHTIALCPYSIAVYVLAQEPATVYLSYRRPMLPSGHKAAQPLEAVDRLLAEIVQEALR
ncbi:MAG TPA: DUF302 domain-containing protein [Burkholderiales bacterium]